jgi:NADPH:quinone reductase-like Zn-dependent oxidoreductase
MRALEIQQFGLDNLAVVERDVPRPGEGQALVRMRSWSLNYRDLMVIEGTYNPKMKRPITPFSDGAGEVVETGPGVTRVKAGDRVMAAFMQKWISGQLSEEGMKSALGGAIDGVGAEYVVLDAEGLVPIPDYLSFEEAASLPCAGVTAWHALVTEGHLRPEQSVLTLGTGGVSVFALQFAKLMHARVVATSSKAEKIERLRGMGADQTINYVEEPDWFKPARGVDHVVEVGGKDTLPKSLRAVRPGGSVYVIGVLSGKAEADLTSVFMRNIRLQGIFVGSREMAEDMLRAMEAHQLRPVIDRVFAFGETRNALRYMRTGAHFGKIVVRADAD